MKWRASAALLALALAGCGGGRDYAREGSLADRAAPLRPAPDRFDRVGYASWYGEELEGRRTASGMRFDPKAMTAAHRTLPLGSYAEVTALDSGRQVLVMINDRGPGRRDREIDLSRGAAQSLAIEHTPLARVRVRSVLPDPEDVDRLVAGRAARPPRTAPQAALVAWRTGLPDTGPRYARQTVTPPSASGRWQVQVATFSYRPRAEELAARLDGDTVAAGTLWRVVTGPYRSAEKAERARDDAVARGYGDARILAAE